VHIHADGEEQRRTKRIPLLAVEQHAVELGGKGRLLPGANHGFDDFIGGLLAGVLAHGFAIHHRVNNRIIHFIFSRGISVSHFLI